jgi:tetratricopeptide (TPR) repeat protein
MIASLRKLLIGAAAFVVLAGSSAWAQTGTIDGKVIGEDGAGLRDAMILIERLDVRGNYKVKTNKKGEYLHAGLPLGNYKVSCQVNGQIVDTASGVRTRLGENVTVDFNLAEIKKRQEALQAAAATGTLTQEQTRGMSAAEKAAIEKQMKEREAGIRKNRELNEAFNAGVAANKSGDFQTAIDAFTKAGELDPKQDVVWVQLAEAHAGMAGSKTGAEQTAAFDKSIEAWKKALELKPADANYFNNYALLLAKASKFDEASQALEKAAQLDPPSAGKYFYNLGAVLTNIGQLEPAGAAFKKAIDADPNYADAQYQYGIYLMSKAQVSDTGAITPPPGTKEAFAKYIELKPDGPFAESAKQMIASLDATIDTSYENPDAKKAGGKKAAPAKKK